MTLSPAKSLPIRGMRRAISRKMMESLATTAQLSYTTRVDATLLVSARNGWKNAGVKTGYEDLLLVAVRDTLTAFPRFNAIATADSLELYDEVCISVAIAIQDGLVAPALPDLRGLGVPEIAAARRDLIERARSGKLTVPELSFGTFTISNMGTTRVDHFTPILNGGQVAILGSGRISAIIGLGADGRMEPRHELALSLTTDHRVIDGAPSGEFLTGLAERIEHRLPRFEA